MNLKKTFIEFNQIYGLPINNSPVLLDAERLRNFQSILLEEVGEAGDIYNKHIGAVTDADKLNVLVEIADWLGDIVWYVNSEAIKYGLDMEKILEILRQSNLSKLDKDGNAIYDERGKVMRGPNYAKPEEALRKYIAKDLNS